MKVNRQSLSSIFRQFKVLFNKSLVETPSLWKQIAMMQPSKTRENVYTWMADLPMMREWTGDRKIKNMSLDGYTLVNKHFEVTVGVPIDDIVNDNIGLYEPKIKSLGESAKQHMDILLFDALKAGFDSACYDGQSFFDTDHPVAGASVSNDGGGSGTPWFLCDLSRTLKPMIMQVHTKPKLVALDNPTDENVFFRKEVVYGVDDRKAAGYGMWQLAYGSKDTLNDTNYAAARVAMKGLTNDSGVKLGINPTHLLYPSSLESAARTLIKGQIKAAGESNIWYESIKLLEVPWL